MANKEELLEYLTTNFKKKGHPLYHAGIGTIYFIFDGNLKVKDIQDFVERQHSYTIFKETKKGPLRSFFFARLRI